MSRNMLHIAFVRIHPTLPSPEKIYKSPQKCVVGCTLAQLRWLQTQALHLQAGHTPFILSFVKEKDTNITGQEHNSQV